MPVVIFTGEDPFRLIRKAREMLHDNEGGAAVTQSFDEESNENFPDVIRRFFDERTLWNDRKIAIARAASWTGKLPAVTGNDLLILILKKPPATLPKNIAVMSFPVLKGAGIAKWIIESGNELGNVIQRDLADALIELHGSDTGAIWNELMILSSAKPGEKLSADDLKMFRLWIPHVKDFAFVNAVLAKNRKHALGLLRKTLAEGASPLLVLGNLAAHFRAMLVTKGDKQTARRYFAGKHPFWVSEISKHAERFTQEELRSALKRLWRADHAIKTGSHAQDTALEEFVLGV